MVKLWELVIALVLAVIGLYQPKWFAWPLLATAGGARLNRNRNVRFCTGLGDFAALAHARAWGREKARGLLDILNMIKIPLTRGYVMWVDDDAPAVLAAAGVRKICAFVQYRRDESVLNVYAVGRRHGKYIRVHRTLLAWKLGRNLESHEEVDHVHHRETEMIVDNRAENIRLATRAQNQANRRKVLATSSLYKGVTRRYNHLVAPWVASIRIDGKNTHLGYFISEVDAARAYNVSALAAWGEFALINDVAPMAEQMSLFAA